MEDRRRLSRRIKWAERIGGLPLVAWFLEEKIQRKLRKTLRWRGDNQQRLRSVAIPGMGSRLYFRSRSSDLDVIDQVLLCRDYSVFESIENPSLIVDAGANIGAASLYFLMRFPRAHCIAIEPDERNVEVLRRNLAPFKERVTLVCGGLWHRRAGLKVLRGEYGDGREWATTVRECRGAEPPDVEGYALPDLLSASGKQCIDILKIDIEGSELGLLRSQPEAWLDRTKNLAIELHGEECRRAFREALIDYSFQSGRFGENELALGLSRRAEKVARVDTVSMPTPAATLAGNHSGSDVQ